MSCGRGSERGNEFGFQAVSRAVSWLCPIRMGKALSYRTTYEVFGSICPIRMGKSIVLSDDLQGVWLDLSDKNEKKLCLIGQRSRWQISFVQ